MAINNSLNILTDEEIDELYEIPKIDAEDRELLFEITVEDEVYLEQQKNIYNKINYILQSGYFRASRQFYNFAFSDVRDDTWFIINRYFPHAHFPKKLTSKGKHYAAQKTILSIYSYKRYEASFAIEVSRQAKRLSKRDISPHFIFDELLNFFENHQIVRPKYSTLQDLVSLAIQREEKRLAKKLGILLDKTSRDTLDGLLADEQTITDLTLLKQDPKSFATNEMRKELKKQQKLVEIFQQSKSIIPKLAISRQNIQYYADICDFYDVYQLKRFDLLKSRLCMMCFVWQRFIKLNDHLTTYLVHKIQGYEKQAEVDAGEKILEAKLGVGEDRKLASQMLKVVNNQDIHQDQIRPKCYAIIKKDNFDEFTNKLAEPEVNNKKYEWEYYSKEHNAIKTNLRSTFMAIDFSCGNNHHLNKAINFIKKLVLSKDKMDDRLASEVPTDFISATQLKYMTYKSSVKLTLGSKHDDHNVKFVNIKRYEVMLYRALAQTIKSGSIFISDSVNYRHLEDDLISLERWNKNKAKILNELSDCLNLKSIVELLQEKEIELEALYKMVNARIKSKENKEIKINENNLSWTLPYKRAEDKANNPFYQDIETKSISKVIDYTAKHTGFFDSFTHILNKGSKSKAQPDYLKAYFVAQGTSIGNKRIAESSDVSLENLKNIAGKFIRIDSMIDASDQIINKTAQLPIFNNYNLSDYGIHASLDGQKLETRYQTVQSRYSTKYFGYGKGVVSYSLIANHLPVNTKIIGANEHESHYVLDIVYNNTSDLNITSVSGDMHSINRVNFGLMHLFGYDFMPRFTQLNMKAEKNLVAFNKPSEYSELLIKPSSQINKQLIIDEWDNILRILASLALKETSQSTIIRKLSSYSKKNPTQKALIEFDKMIMSIYMLNYINDIDLRRRVSRALNRGEAFHQLRAGILQISGKKLLGKTDKAYEISNQCNKILACCIIYYNTSILSELLAKAEAANDEVLCSQIKRFSPVAWQHINLLGNFEFRHTDNIINIQDVTKFAVDNNINTKTAESLAS